MKKLENIGEYARTEDLTIDELKGSEEFNQFTDEQLKSFVDFFKTFSYLVYQTHRIINECEEEKDVIEINSNNEIKLAA